MNAGAGGVPVADLHAAVDLGDGEAPGDELTHQVIERLLVFGEDEQLHLGVAEDPLFGDDGLELGELGLDGPRFDHACLINESGQPGDLVA